MLGGPTSIETGCCIDCRTSYGTRVFKKTKCVLCGANTIPVDNRANALDNSRLTVEGHMHDDCYEKARKILLSYVTPSEADRIRRRSQPPASPTINIRVRKMRIDP